MASRVTAFAPGRRLKTVAVERFRPGARLKDGNEGNAASLIKWYEDDPDNRFQWGTPGDWRRCVDVASQYIDDAEGFCQLRHMAATGMTTSEHAEEDKG